MITWVAAILNGIAVLMLAGIYAWYCRRVLVERRKRQVLDWKAQGYFISRNKRGRAFIDHSKGRRGASA